MKTVAVLPFRVTGADSSLGFLREGMVDLLAAKLSGTEHLRTVNPQSLITAWRRVGGSTERSLERADALALARRLGADWLLEGEVTGTSRRVVMSAALTAVADYGEVRTSSEAPYDSLTGIVDELAAQLLALGSGESRYRLAAATSTSLPALRAYLDGRAALRRGTYGPAIRSFDTALELDSTFALAALARSQAGAWVGERGGGTGALLAWRHRDRLPPTDRAIAEAIVGPRFPRYSTLRDHLGAMERVVALAPDNPEGWANLGDWLFHYGLAMGIADAHGRSLRAYRTALSWDSAYAPSLEHLTMLLAELQDTAGVRWALRHFLSLDSTSSHAVWQRWYVSLVLHDSVVHAELAGSDSLLERYHGVLDAMLAQGLGIDDADSLRTPSPIRPNRGRACRYRGHGQIVFPDPWLAGPGQVTGFDAADRSRSCPWCNWSSV